MNPKEGLLRNVTVEPEEGLLLHVTVEPEEDLLLNVKEGLLAPVNMRVGALEAPVNHPYQPADRLTGHRAITTAPHRL